MDPGRYGAHQRLEHNSALDGYGAVHEPRYRVGSSYDERRHIEERFPRDNVHTRSSFHRGILERESCPPARHSGNHWPSSRRRSYEEEHPLERDPRREGTLHFDTYDEMDTFDEVDDRDGCRSSEYYNDREFDRYHRHFGPDQDEYHRDDLDRRPRMTCQNRENSRERDYRNGRWSYDSDPEMDGRKESSWGRDSRECDGDRRPSQEKDRSPYRRRERSLSRSRDCRSRSRSRGRSHSYSHQDDTYDAAHYERGERRKDREEKHHHDQFSSVQSATVVVKGLSHKTTEEDLYQFLAEWGPIRHVRVIKERTSGFSRGFAFIDFPTVGSARLMMDAVGDGGLLVDGRKLIFEYSSKTTGASNGNYGQENHLTRTNQLSHKSMNVPTDWMCVICRCVNFARRTSCFQCNEMRTEDAPATELDLNSIPGGRKGLETGPSHVLVVRGLDENADEEMLRYEFSKHAPLKDIRLVRDKFTHVSRGFAFVHFHTIEDASKTLEATNGTALERNGQTLRVAFAKSILGPGSSAFGSLQSSSLAAAAIEAATFAQQYDSVGWAPKEYNPDEKHSLSGSKASGSHETIRKSGSAPQSGFVWDEASGYYYDAASGFYYDGNTGLYYDGNSGTWYSYDNQTQQYVRCTSDQNETKPSEKPDSGKTSDASTSKRVVISAPASTVKPSDKSSSLPDAVEAAAAAAIAAEKKEKERSKEIRLFSKTSILANKKKMNTVLTKWKQRNHEGQAPRVALDDDQTPSSDNKGVSFLGTPTKTKPKSEPVFSKDTSLSNSGNLGSTMVGSGQTTGVDPLVKPRPVSNSLGGTVMGVIRGSGRGVIRSDTLYSGSVVGPASPPPTPVPASTTVSTSALSSSIDVHPCATPFKTDASALGSYTPGSSSSSVRRRFSEAPQHNQKEQPQTIYRDRAAERRTLYGSSSSISDDVSGISDSNGDLASKKGSHDSMPFPPGVGGGRGAGNDSCNASSYEVIADDKAIGERNVGNRMLRSMGWHEGLGLGKDGGGVVEPVRARAVENRAGLGNHQQKVEPWMEVHVGDSYRTVIHKKAQARFREMSS